MLAVVSLVFFSMAGSCDIETEIESRKAHQCPKRSKRISKRRLTLHMAYMHEYEKHTGGSRKSMYPL